MDAKRHPVYRRGVDDKLLLEEESAVMRPRRRRRQRNEGKASPFDPRVFRALTCMVRLLRSVNEFRSLRHN